VILPDQAVDRAKIAAADPLNFNASLISRGRPPLQARTIFIVLSCLDRGAAAPTGGGVANVERIADRQKGQTAALFGQQADRCPAGDLRKGLKARGKPKKIAT
jgi:hypothetical protein